MLQPDSLHAEGYINYIPQDCCQAETSVFKLARETNFCYASGLNDCGVVLQGAQAIASPIRYVYELQAICTQDQLLPAQPGYRPAQVATHAGPHPLAAAEQGKQWQAPELLLVHQAVAIVAGQAEESLQQPEALLQQAEGLVQPAEESLQQAEVPVQHAEGELPAGPKDAGHEAA